MDFVCVKVKGLSDIAMLLVLLKSNGFGQVSSCENQVSISLKCCAENYMERCESNYFVNALFHVLQ